MNIKISNKDMVWGYLGYFFTISTNLLILPFVMHFVETSELGLWYTFLSIGQLVNLLDFGFSNTLVRNITYAFSGVKEIHEIGYSENAEENPEINYRLLASIFKTCQIICLFIAIIALFIMLTVGTTYISHAAKKMTGNHFLIAWELYAIAIFFNIYYSYWLSSLKGIGAIVQAQKANVYSKGIQILVSVVGLIFEGGIIALAAAYLLSGLFIRIYAKYQFKRYSDLWKNTKQYMKIVKKSEVYHNFKKIWVNAKRAGIVSLGTFCTTQTTTLLCSTYLGLDITASYGLCLQIITALTNVSAIYFQTLIPLMTELRISNKTEELKKKLSLSISIFWIVYIVGIIALLTVGLPLIHILKSDSSLPIPMIAMLGSYLFLEMNHSLFATYISLSNKIPYMKPAVISGVIIVIGEFACIILFDFGIYGLMAVQLVVQLAYNNWKWPLVVFKELQLTPVKMVKIACKKLAEQILEIKNTKI